MTRSALLAGATGLVGGYCLERLLADDAWQRVVVPTRRPLGRSHPKLAEVVLDFDHLEEEAEHLAVDGSFSEDVFCCLGTTLAAAGSEEAFERVDFGYVVALAHLAAARGSRRFLLVSAVGADPGSRIFYNRVKGKAEEAVAASGVPIIHILRPSLLLGPRREHRSGEEWAKRFSGLVAPLLVGPLRRWRPIHADAVAGAMVALARRDEPGVFFHEPPPAVDG